MIEILLATFNGQKYLHEQLTSLLNQTYKNFKITIRDDGSTDNTVAIIESYVKANNGKIKLVQDNRHLGSTLSFASLLAASTEDYIMFCDQDDFWLENKIEVTFLKMKELEMKHENLPLLVFTDLTEVDGNLNLVSKSFFQSQKLYPSICNNPTKLIALNVVAGCTTMINRKALEFILPFPSSNINHDQWMAVNISHYGIIKFIPTPTILYRQHENNFVGANKVGISYFSKKLFSPFKQYRIYRDLISNLKFRVNTSTFAYYKLFFTLKRLFFFK